MLLERLRGFFIIKKHGYLFAMLFFFGVVYSLISLVNHYNFRTNALDLGLYTNALYDYIHFQWNDSSVFKMYNENLLADHFDLYLIIFSPLSLLFGTYTLLIVQILALLIGGIGVYFFFTARKNSSVIIAISTLYFYCFFGVFGALAYDYHSNVVASAIVPWFFYFVQNKNKKAAVIVLVLVLISKENISLWMAFVCLGLAVSSRYDWEMKKFLLANFIFCSIYFYLIITVVMPALSYSGTFAHFNYDILGTEPIEAIIKLITSPLDSVRVLFVNHSGNENFDYIKVELYSILILSGLPFLFWKPHYLVMLVPIIFQKMFHNNPSMWGIGLQYNIEFAPIMAIGVFDVISTIKKKNTQHVVAWMAILMVVSATIRIMDRTIYFTKKSKIRFYQASHYKREYNVSNVYQQLSKLPPDAIICAQSPFLPHLALRDHIYEFPRIKNAEYIVYSDYEDFYVNSEEEFRFKTESLKLSKEWKVLYDQEIVILKRDSLFIPNEDFTK